MDQLAFGADDFAENPEPRVPCILLLDTSTSMSGEPIRQLNHGLAAFKEELMTDSLASKRVEPAVVAFGDSVRTLCDFSTADQFVPPVLEANGMTPMGQAVDLAINMIESRKATYKSNGIAYYRPWVFLITDGEPNDAGWEAAASRAIAAQNAKSFALFAVGVDSANLNVLKMFSVKDPIRLKGLSFKEMFVWLSSSLRSVSRSTPGEEVPLENPTGPKGWASIG